MSIVLPLPVPLPLTGYFGRLPALTGACRKKNALPVTASGNYNYSSCLPSAENSNPLTPRVAVHPKLEPSWCLAWKT